jgi:hypothetical protein
VFHTAHWVIAIIPYTNRIYHLLLYT